MFHLRGSRESRLPLNTVKSSVRARSASPQRSNDRTVPPPAYATLNWKLKRGLSRTSENFTLVRQARAVVLNDVAEASSGTAEWPNSSSVNSGEPTFLLPDFEQFPRELRDFLYADLVEVASLGSLQYTGRLNWWVEMGVCQRLLPMATAGDGNCLLHAASLGMWGFHDRLLTLRQALYNMLSSQTENGEFRRRWRWHQTQVNNESELVFSEEEWRTEWEMVLAQASPTPRPRPCDDNRASTAASTAGGERSSAVYASLEQVHVFALAQVLQRAVIVVSDTILRDASGSPLAPIPFGGIYLPCGVCAVHRTPLLLAYDAAHFSPLVAIENDLGSGGGKGQGRRHSDEPLHLAAAIPLVDPDLHLLPIHFVYDPGASVDWQNPEPSSAPGDEQTILSDLSRYLDIAWLPSSDKTGVAKQMHTVARQFGSLGRSMSRKFKGLTGGLKKEAWVRPGGALPCARLVHRRPAYQQKMLDNYITAARERLAQQQQQQQEQEKQDKEKQEHLQQEKQQKAQDERDGNNEPVLRNGELSRQNTLFNLGKSKFYTLSSEQHSAQPSREDIAGVVGEQLSHQSGSEHDALHLARSSFYNYDFMKHAGNRDESSGGNKLDNSCPFIADNNHISDDLGKQVCDSHAGIRHAPSSHTGISQAPTSYTGISHAPASHIGISHANASHTGISHAPASHTGVSHTSASHTGVSHAPASHAGISHAPASHTGISHAPASHTGVSHTPAIHTGVSHAPASHVGLSHAPANHAVMGHTPANNTGIIHVPASHTGIIHAPRSHIGISHDPASHAGIIHAPASHTRISHAPGSHTGISHAPASYTGTNHGHGSHTGISNSPAHYTGISHAPSNHTGISHAPTKNTGIGHAPTNHTGIGHVPANHVEIGHVPANNQTSPTRSSQMHSTPHESATSHTPPFPTDTHHAPPNSPASESRVPASYRLRAAHLMRTFNVPDNQSDNTKETTSPKCQTVDCPFFSRASTDFMCSTCYKAKQSKLPPHGKTKL